MTKEELEVELTRMMAIPETEGRSYRWPEKLEIAHYEVALEKLARIEIQQQAGVSEGDRGKSIF